jgi:hypothetical protein
VWITIASIGGALWIWNAFRLRDGIHSARWACIPCLLAAFLCLPLLGWIVAPVGAYGLFLDKTTKQFFKKEKNCPTTR